MPLERGNGTYYADLDGIYFIMRDAETGARVACRASYPYLQARKEDPEADQNALISFFETIREEMEGIASRKYNPKRPGIVVVG